MSIEPVFFIGLGGTGTRIVTRIKRTLRARAGRPGTLKWDDLKQVVHFYGIDTRSQDTGVSLERGAEFQALAADGESVRGGEMVDTLLTSAQYPEYGSYFEESWHNGPGNHDHPGVFFTDGAGACRRYGRLCLDYRIQTTGELPLVGTVAKALNQLSQMDVDGQRVETHKATALVFGSLSGGSCSGIALDVAQLLRHETRIGRIFGIFVLPSVFEAEGTNNTNIKNNMVTIRANNAAALAEILYYSGNVPYKRVWPRSGKTMDEVSVPYDVAFLVGREHPTKALSGLDDAINLCAHCFSTMYTSEAAIAYASDLINQVATRGGGGSGLLFGRIGHRRVRLATERVAMSLYDARVGALVNTLRDPRDGDTSKALLSLLASLKGGEPEVAVELDRLSEEETWLEAGDRDMKLYRVDPGVDRDEFQAEVDGLVARLHQRQQELDRRLDESWPARRDHCFSVINAHILQQVEQGPEGYGVARGVVEKLRLAVEQERGELVKRIETLKGEIDALENERATRMEQWLARYKGVVFGLGAHPEEAQAAANDWLQRYWNALCSREEAEANDDFLGALSVYIVRLHVAFAKMDAALNDAGKRGGSFRSTADRDDLFTVSLPRSDAELEQLFGDELRTDADSGATADLYTAWLSGSVGGEKVTGEGGKPVKGLRDRLGYLFAGRRQPAEVAEGLERDLRRVGERFRREKVERPLAESTTLLGMVARQMVAEAGSKGGQETARDYFGRWIHAQMEQADAYGRLTDGTTLGGAFTIYADLKRLDDFVEALEFKSPQDARQWLEGTTTGLAFDAWKFCHVGHEGARHELIFHRLDSDIVAGEAAFPDYAQADPDIFDNPNWFTDHRFPTWLRAQDTAHLREAHLLGLAAEWEGVIQGNKGAAMGARRGPGTVYEFSPYLTRSKGLRVAEARAECYRKLQEDDGGVLAQLRDALRQPLGRVAPGDRKKYWEQIRAHLDKWFKASRDKELRELLEQQIRYVDELLTRHDSDAARERFFRTL